MKFKVTLILFGLFILLLAAVYLIEFKDQGDEGKDMLVSLSTENVEKMVFRTEGETIQFQKEGEEWWITDPIRAKGDKYEVNRLADDFTNLRIERIVEEEPSDLAKYGIPQNQVEIYYRDKENPEDILIGSENPLDNTYFAKKNGESRVVLIPSSLKSLLEKKLFDFRQKNIFQFEADQAKKIKLTAGDVQWEAEKVEEDWFLIKPVNALAQKSKINDILNALSNLKATAFLSENKREEEIKQFGLDEPDYEVEIDFPAESGHVTYFIHKNEEITRATSSVSPKIIQVEDSILADLKKEAEVLRDKEIVDFFTWEVSRLYVRRGELSLTLTKDKEGKWHSEDPALNEVDGEKIQSFLRKLEALEGQEFVDPPLDLAEYGLDTPQAEVKIWSGKEEEIPVESTIQIGKEDTESKFLYIKNARFAYLFKVDANFLEEFPGKTEDWKNSIDEEKKKQED